MCVAVYFPLGVLDLLVGKRDPVVPPGGLRFVGGGHYTLDGWSASIRWKFLYPDAEFDFVFLIFILTHMLTDAAQNYVSEGFLNLGQVFYQLYTAQR